MGSVSAICISTQRGVKKKSVQSAKLIRETGIENDAHAQGGDRQVSLLMEESINRVREHGIDVNFGDFAENIVTSGVNLRDVRIGDRIRLGESLLEITIIGKECHTPCHIYYQMGSCIMPDEGVFCRDIKPGNLSVGDGVEIVAHNTQESAPRDIPR